MAVVIICIVDFLFVSLAILIMTGKADMLISGYNMATKKQQEKYDVKRLRLLMGIELLLFAVLVTLAVLLLIPYWVCMSAFWAILVFVVVFGNFWTKKK